MERLMERKLALLEAEYNACVNAEQQQQQTSADEAALQGYGRVGAGGGLQRLHGGDGEDGDEDEEEEFSPAWTRFKADMEEEQLRQQAAGAEESDGGRPDEESKEERRVHAPLTSDKISSIKTVMSGIKLRPPPWAVGMPEEVWMARILERAGFVRRAMAARTGNGSGEQPQQQQPILSEEERQRRKDKKKARKAKKAKEAKQQQSEAAAAMPQPAAAQAQEASDGSVAAPTAAASFTEDFETSFPAMPSPRSSPPSAMTAADTVTQTA